MHVKYVELMWILHTMYCNVVVTFEEKCVITSMCITATIQFMNNSFQ